DRSKLRYPSDLTDDEWTHVEPLIPPAKRGGNKRHVEVREVMNGIMYILNIVRMGSAGRERLGTSDQFVGSLDSQVPHPTFDDAEAEANNELVERLEDNGTHTGLVVIAPHGGDIEPHTDQQAERVASRLAAKGVSLWRCKGFKGEAAFARWHITST